MYIHTDNLLPTNLSTESDIKWFEGLDRYLEYDFYNLTKDILQDTPLETNYINAQVNLKVEIELDGYDSEGWIWIRFTISDSELTNEEFIKFTENNNEFIDFLVEQERKYITELNKKLEAIKIPYSETAEIFYTNKKFFVELDGDVEYRSIRIDASDIDKEDLIERIIYEAEE